MIASSSASPYLHPEQHATHVSMTRARTNLLPARLRVAVWRSFAPRLSWLGGIGT